MSGCVILDSGIVARKNGKRLPCEVLQAENAKLRELVADMFVFLDGADCARFPAGDVVITQAQVGNFYDRMRELGVTT